MRLFFTCMLLAITFNASAQKIRFTDSSNTWITYRAEYFCSYSTTYRYGSDTIYHGVKYRKLFQISNFLYGDPSCHGYRIDSSQVIREDTLANKVYYRVLDSYYYDTAEHLLYDYNLQAGDTIYYNLFRRDSVLAVDSVKINGVFHKVLHFKGRSSTWREYSVVEGLGCLSGAFFPGNGGCFEFEERINCFSHEGVTPDFGVFNNNCYVADTFRNISSCIKLSVRNDVSTKKLLSFYPNPSNEILNISIAGYADFPLTVLISDLLGQSVLHTTIKRSGTIQLPTAGIPPGTYILSLGNTASSERKIITIVH